MDSTRSFAYDEKDASPYDRGTLAAIFDTPEQAKQALKDLHAADFKKTWMGATATSSGLPSGVYEPATNTFTPDSSANAGVQVETIEGGGFGGALSRFFGESNQQSLHEALIAQGVPASDAVALEDKMHDGGAVITVQVQDRYDEAIQILRQDRGSLATTGIPSAAPATSSTTGTVPSAATPAGTGITDEDTLTLSEERLSIDKQRVSAGEATISKKVVSEEESVDVPIMREELFIQRRPVAPGERAVAGTIGTDETYRVPLMRDQVVVDKRTFVTEEVGIGKRAVAETHRVSDTVRHEELVVNDSTARAATDTIPRTQN